MAWVNNEKEGMRRHLGLDVRIVASSKFASKKLNAIRGKDKHENNEENRDLKAGSIMEMKGTGENISQAESP